MNLLLLAIAPIVIIILYIYLKDTLDKEPIKLLLINFILGAFVSVLITLVLGYFLDKTFPVTNAQNIYQIFIKAFVVVGFTEEFSKYVILKLYAQPHKEFDEPYDGIMYAVMVSMGFAMLENILYVFKYGFQTGITRAFTAVPAHATFAILMGYFMGKAKFSNNRAYYNLLGLFIATVFHGAYDFFLFINYIPGISVGAFLSLFLGFFLANKAIKIHQTHKSLVE
ncbi:PrsW family intramembrane metalloprotease [Tenacibaculum geojense]|uniref:Protease PrsW n=1 Tax=Tenacibaculum geojense TaxID=915352 RepID=A0ABW3JTV7_9FLAO